VPSFGGFAQKAEGSIIANSNSQNAATFEKGIVFRVQAGLASYSTGHN
jgi:hypothetical protein